MTVTISGFGPEPISVGQARAHTNIDDITDDALIADYIAAARAWAEKQTGSFYRSATAVVTFETLTSPLDLGLTPVNSVTSITYSDVDGATQTLDTGAYVLTGGIVEGEDWPEGVNVTVTCSVGYDSHTIPDDDRVALYRMVAHQYDNRGQGGHLEGFARQLFNSKTKLAF